MGSGPVWVWEFSIGLMSSVGEGRAAGGLWEEGGCVSIMYVEVGELLVRVGWGLDIKYGNR